ncbi:DUF748 domain-containing protein [Mucilaginibacter sp. Bleaf8]|uniref:DUF748 domain-containing protein n=1 Tax=Mucilaginibacter sp. Bleaf8 TaxID=2834430 RepID=UPI001BD15068|nr:DUF748 domain-containing protein [Mucilaginibacter sp. Bleaf8]MBS7563734.1 DUF748 domain-containing protein [Mucilaginibacter sp. Bleaf8]
MNGIKLRKRYWIIIGFVLLVIIVRLALPSIVKSYVNRKLNNLPGYTGHVDDIDIHLIRGAYAIDGLVLKKNTDAAKYPTLQIRHTDLSIEWKSLFKGRLVGEVIMNEPKVHLLANTHDPSEEPSKEHWTETVKALMPMTVNRLQVNNGRVAYLDFKASPDVNLHIDNMQLTALNLANVEKAATPLPSTVWLTGTSIGSGKLKMDMKVNVLKELPDFDLNARLTGVKLTSLNDFIEAKGKIDVEKGTLDMYSELKATNGRFNGYVKPFIKNVKVLNWKKDVKKKGGIFQAAKEAVVGLFTKAVENPKTKKIATKVPISGSFNDPKTSGWKTFIGVLKNAFIKAFTQGIDNTLD